ncbi:nitroreductase family deazaflavin-dependent oxidoreductase [Streptomyces sp. NBC_01497]|uniref:nitroreductase family deazaflavin-dependent oxidoreductase n=1 Tax=Streptomyces sp. NBC_01497 TaxID=2903885 RepID=UPI002E2FA6C6|nr:nitroreductase family deazaflavin-dependent oxidoreductase [Streptomyces sp. NBC_01497]
MAEHDDAVISPTGWVAEQAKEYAESGGTRGTDVNGSPCLLLDYRGRTSGVWRRTVLIYGRDGEDYLVVASKGGADEHPLWYLNLVAEPDVRVQVGPERFAARAETLSTGQKARVWPGLLDVYAPYADYQAKTERDIPVVRLRRAQG